MGQQTPYTPTEQAFAKLLDKRKAEGAILDWQYTPVTLSLDATRYQPSFGVWEPDGFVFIELRQPRQALEDNPEIYCKAAAQRWPEYDWLILAPHRKGWLTVWGSAGTRIGEGP